MIQHTSPKRTKLLLRIRRLLTAGLLREKSEWPVEAIHTLVTNEMKSIGKLPARKLRAIAANL